MLWIIENWSQQRSSLALATAIESLGFELKMLRDFRVADWKDIEGPVMFQGSINMADIMVHTMTKAYPVSWKSKKNFLCSTYYPHFGSLLFNDYYVMLPLSEFHRQKFFCYGTFGKETKVFLRPDSGEKTFTGQLVDLQDHEEFINLCKSLGIEHELVIVSTPKNIRGEYRFVVSEKGIIAQSTYQFQGLRTIIPSTPKGAREMCEKVIAVGWHPAPVYCVDIAEDNDGKFWLLELTSFTSAGLYACNPTDIVREVSKIAQEKYKAYLTERQAHATLV
jgi:hypothetical protein